MQQLLTPLWPAPAPELPEPFRFLTVPGTTADSDDVHALFRKTFRWERGKKLLFAVTSHGRYRFELNGRFFGLGPVRGSDYRLFYDTYDLTEALQPGENVLTIQYHYPGSSYRTVAAARPALFAAFVPEEPAGTWEYASDIRYGRSFEYTFQLGKCENRDDRKNAFAFVPAETADNPNQVRLLPRPIPPLTNEEYPFPRVIRQGFLPEFSPDDDDFAARMATEVQFDALEAFDGKSFAVPPEGCHGCFVVFDLGREFYGNVEVELEGDAGVIVDRAYDEVTAWGRLQSAYFFGNWTPRARHAGDAYRFADRRILAGGRCVVTAEFADRGGRFLMLAVRNHKTAIRVHRISAVDRISPVPRSEFTCDDPFFERLDRMCVHTVRHCVADSFVDCPWREQAFWANDLVVSAHYWLLLTAEPALVENALLTCLDGRRKYGWLPAVYPAGDSMPFQVCPALWVLVLNDCFMNKGNETFLKNILPRALELMGDYRRFTDETGLVPEHPTWWNFIDLAYVNAKSDLQGHTAVLNSLIAAAWHCLADLGAGETAEKESRRICEAMKKHLWDDERRMFRDSDAPGHGRELYSAHPAAVCLCYDLMPELKEALSGQLYAEGVLQPEPYYQRFALEAAFRTNQTENALREIRRIWRAMVLSDSPTLWELGEFGPRPTLGTANSCCHAFSAAPMWFFRRVLAGIRPLEPGFRRFVCEPLYEGDFRCIQPTPAGPIEAEQKAGVLTVRAPAGTERVTLS